MNVEESQGAAVSGEPGDDSHGMSVDAVTKRQGRRGDMIKKDPELVQLMVDGAMEGLKLQLLEPGKALDIMIAAKPELKTVPKKLLLTHAGNTNVLSISPAVENHGLGWMAEADQTKTRDVVIKYMNAKNVPPTSALFTNRFAGNVKLSAAEWSKAKELAAPYDPSKKS